MRRSSPSLPRRTASASRVAVAPPPAPPSLTPTSPAETHGFPAKPGSFVFIRKLSTEVVPLRERTPSAPSATGALNAKLSANVPPTETLADVPLIVTTTV